MQQIEAEAALFRRQLADMEWQPDEWSDVGEICFEWIAPGRHAIVSIEGDGAIGYAMLVADRFVAGSEVAPPSRMPDDLRAYISQEREAP
jgi:hypothetical protein